jgi:hypothetical protein
MRKIWKWVLGIVLVLMLVGAMFAIGFAWRTHTFSMVSYRDMPYGREGNGPMMQPGNEGWGRQPMMYGRNGGERSMMGGRGFQHFGGGFSPLGGLVKLAVFIGLLYGAYWLGKRNARITLDPKPAAPVAEVPAPQAGTPPA